MPVPIPAKTRVAATALSGRALKNVMTATMSILTGVPIPVGPWAVVMAFCKQAKPVMMETKTIMMAAEMTVRLRFAEMELFEPTSLRENLVTRRAMLETAISGMPV